MKSSDVAGQLKLGWEAAGGTQSGVQLGGDQLVENQPTIGGSIDRQGSTQLGGIKAGIYAVN